MKLTLPYPPSANRYWRNVKGRMLVSREARLYKKVVKGLVEGEGLVMFVGEVCLAITIYRPQRSGDLSNRIKVVEDALAGIAYANDSQVVELHAYRRDDKHNPRVVIEVRGMEESEK